MLCYGDMTFCPFFGDCAKAEICCRPLTADVAIAAEHFGLPVARFIDKPECHEPTKDPIDGDAAHSAGLPDVVWCAGGV